MRLARLAAWSTALLGLMLLASYYEQLPATLPVTRWTTAPKSLLTALRIPSLNLLTIALLDVIRRVLLRSPHRAQAPAVLVPLYATAAAKAALETGELLALPQTSPWILFVLIGVVAVGVSWAALRARSMTSMPWRAELRLTGNERAGVAVILIGVVALQFAP